MTEETKVRTQTSATEKPNPERVSIRWVPMVYLMLAIAGAILPWMANIEFMKAHGPSMDLGLFVAMANANPAAQSLSRDLAIGATAVTIWMVLEGRRLQMKGVGWVLLSCVTIAFAFGAPLFLYLRERRLNELASDAARAIDQRIDQASIKP
jgi:hypothetical protein